MFNINRRVPWVPHDLALHVRNVFNRLGVTGSISFFVEGSRLRTLHVQVSICNRGWTHAHYCTQEATLDAGTRESLHGVTAKFTRRHIREIRIFFTYQLW